MVAMIKFEEKEDKWWKKNADAMRVELATKAIFAIFK